MLEIICEGVPGLKAQAGVFLDRPRVRTLETELADSVPRVGRSATMKTQVTLKVDEEVIGWFIEGGPGWKNRMVAALRQTAGL